MFGRKHRTISAILTLWSRLFAKSVRDTWKARTWLKVALIGLLDNKITVCKIHMHSGVTELSLKGAVMGDAHVRGSMALHEVSAEGSRPRNGVSDCDQTGNTFTAVTPRLQGCQNLLLTSSGVFCTLVLTLCRAVLSARAQHFLHNVSVLQLSTYNAQPVIYNAQPIDSPRSGQG